jgi:hypothetical protein
MSRMDILAASHTDVTLAAAPELLEVLLQADGEQFGRQGKVGLGGETVASWFILPSRCDTRRDTIKTLIKRKG